MPTTAGPQKSTERAHAGSRFGETSEEVIAKVRAADGRCLLSFSTGKDAIGAHLAIRERFDEVVPYYLYLVPGMEFVEDSLAYYERTLFGGRHIVRMPHPSFARMMNALTFQPPERCAKIDALGFVEFDYIEVADAIKAELGWPEGCMTATGVRAADSPIRYLHFKKRGGVNYTRRLFYPIFEWNKDRLYRTIAASGVKLPIDYRFFGRTFDGIDLRFLYQIKQHFPRDYARILEWFPLADMEVFRHEKRAQQ